MHIELAGVFLQVGKVIDKRLLQVSRSILLSYETKSAESVDFTGSFDFFAVVISYPFSSKIR